MATKPYPSESQDRFIVRLPDGMRDRIAEEAKANNRSMNAEIVGRLEASFALSAPSQRVAELEAMAQQHKAVIEAMSGELDRARELAESYKALLKIAGMYLRTTAERVPKSANPVSNELMSIMQTVGGSFSSGDLEAAVPAITRMIELGVATKVFEPDGTPGPNRPSSQPPAEKRSYANYAKEVLETGREPSRSPVKRIRRTRPPKS